MLRYSYQFSFFLLIFLLPNFSFFHQAFAIPSMTASDMPSKICDAIDSTVNTVEVRGQIQMLQADDFKNHQTKTIYYVNDPKNLQNIRLHGVDLDESIQTGTWVRLKGQSLGSDFCVRKIQIDQRAAFASPIGLHKAIVILVSYQADPTVTPAELQTIKNALYQNPKTSVNGLYQESSYNQLEFTFDVVGPYPVQNPMGCNPHSDSSQADAAANAAGVDLTSYNHKIYTYVDQPTQQAVWSTCPWAGLGTVGGSPGVSWNVYFDSAGVFGHELGHNLGMHHSSLETTPTFTCWEPNAAPCDEYGDASDVMGYGDMSDISGPHRVQLNWLPPSQIQSITENGTYHLTSLETLPNNANGIPQVIWFPKKNTGDSFYLSYRQGIGYDAGLDPNLYLERLSIHRWNPAKRGQTIFLGSLTDGENFSDPANGVQISNVVHESTGIKFDVILNDDCKKNPPTMSITPTAIASLAGRGVDYAMTISNHDTLACPGTTFNLAQIIPAKWTGNLPTTIFITPQTSSTVNVTLQIPVTAVASENTIPVNVTDSAGGTDHSTSGQTVVTVLPDTIPPEKPVLTAVYNAAAKTVVLNWKLVNDNVGVVKYRVRLDSSIKDLGPKQKTFKIAAPQDSAQHVFTVRALDAAGNKGISNEIHYHYPEGIIP